MTDSSLPPTRFARISSYLHNDHDKAIEVSRNDSVLNDVESHPAKSTSLAPKAYMPKGFHELSDTGKCELQKLEKLGELQAHDSPAEVPSTPVDRTSRAGDKLDGVESVSPIMRQSYELDASNQTDEPKMSEKRMSYQRRASIPFRSSLRSNIFASRKPSSKCSKEAPSSVSSEAAKDRASVDSSAPRHSSNIEYLKDGTDLNNKEVVNTTTRSEGSFEDASRGHYSPTVSDISRLNDRNSTLSAIPSDYQDRNSHCFSEASVGIAEIAELSDRNSKIYHTESSCLQSPISERFSDSPPSWMKRLSNDKSQRCSMGTDEKLNEAGSLEGEAGGDKWHRDSEQNPSSPNTNEKNTALHLSAASSAQRQRSRSRPRRKPVEVEEEASPEYDDVEERQAEQDAFDIVEAASPTLTNFRV